MRLRPNRRSPRRRGAVVLEFALILPLLITLILGIWDVGRMIEVRQGLANAAREGASVASRAEINGVPVTQTTIQTTVRDYLRLSLTDIPTSVANSATVSTERFSGGWNPADPSTASQLDMVRVTVSIPTSGVQWLFWRPFVTSDTLSSTSTWRSMRDVPFELDPNLPL